MNSFSIDYKQLYRSKHSAAARQLKSVSSTDEKQNFRALRQLESASSGDASINSIRVLSTVWNMIVGSLVCQGGQSNQMCTNYGHVIGGWASGLPVCRDCRILITDVAMLRTSKLQKRKSSK